MNATGFTAVVVQEGNGDIVQANLQSPGTPYFYHSYWRNEPDSIMQY